MDKTKVNPIFDLDLYNLKNVTKNIKYYDIIFIVYGCDSINKYKNQIIKMKEIYDKIDNAFKNIKILYFLDNKHSDSLEDKNIIHIKNLNNDYISASYKQWFGLNYVYKYFNTKFVMCIGTDTFINIPKLLNFLKKFNPEENLYIGGHGCHRKILNTKIYFHSGGPGFILSKVCLNKIHPYISNINIFMDEWIKLCNISKSEYLIYACDVAMGYLAQRSDINSIIKKEKGFYHCNYKGFPCHINMFSYENIISCHNMSLNDFDNFNTILKNNNYFMKVIMNFITGEKLQFLCDHFIGTITDLDYNPNIMKYKDRFIFIGTNVSIDNKSFIFCYTHLLDNIDDLILTLKYLENPFKLVFHNSDTCFNNEHLILFEKLPLLQSIYTQNMNVVHKKVLPLPIGLANSMWAHGNHEIHQEVYNLSIEKTKHIYFNFKINTNTEKRTKCYNDIIKKGIKWNENLPYKEYLIELKRHKYAVCPEGNGIDTHRFWECLYMNTIPICLKNTLTEYYKQYFPIIILNDWNELEVNKLDYSYINHQYLDMKYIEQMLKT